MYSETAGERGPRSSTGQEMLQGDSDVSARSAQSHKPSLDPTDVQEWLDTKRKLRETAYRILSKTTIENSLPDDGSLHAEHADAGMALLIVTLRLMHESGGSLTSEQLPLENFINLTRDVAHVYILALGQVEDQLQLRLDAVGMVLFYLKGEQKVLQDRLSAWSMLDMVTRSVLEL
ncbi:hypothetical protein C8T65DRAFT_700581 [Cerioporus squamosus]|nr:hypothetical protein C8T65DRAFT_700581 [Cerioporus squamosus]